MSTNRSRATRRRRSGRTRALLSLGAVAALSTGLSVQGTFAFWTDSATVASGTFTSGTLDITVDGKLDGQAGNGGTTTVATIALQGMVPGESMAAAFPVANVGSVPVVYTLSGTGAGGLATVNGLQYSVTFGGTPTNTGSAAGGNRSGSCGTPATDAGTTLLTGAPSTFPGSTDRNLAVGATERICVVARLHSNAPNDLQGKQGTATFLFDARQVGA